MKAAFIRETGTPSVIEYGELPTPEPRANEVLVKVGAVSVNPIDTYIRAGQVAMASKFPYIIGCDLAGTVVKVGSEAKRFSVGERVWGSNQGLFGRQGTFAEFASVDERWLYRTPPGMTDQEAAAGALVGLTAHLGLFQHADLRPGEVVFVNGGAGGVGSCVVQLAKATGAFVVTTGGNDESLAICKKLGADLALNYHAPNIDDQLRAFSLPHGGIQLWVETQREPTLDRTISLMAPRGRIMLMAGRQARPELPVGPFYVKDLRLIGFSMFNGTPEEQRHAAEGLNALYELNRWRPHIGKVMPLSEAAAAHQLQEENTITKQGTLRGKIVLEP
ncbi:MAG: Bifunctional protein: zinc-containing alcohol dehydrogenase, Similar to arginate lyase [Schlesneria sp.]|nr:Bifunctional protein: zinc-containing alcohol dehydrogenase, Similar to arginate lyase [Schlesneria sp.]